MGLEYIGGATLDQGGPMTELVLASSSPYRRRILQQAGLAVRLCPPEVDERSFSASNPRDLAMILAEAKADAVRLEPGEVGIAADQVAFDPLRGLVFGKPADDEEQLRRLVDLGGREHELHTAWVVWNRERRLRGVERAVVRLRRVHEDELRAYVATGEARGCAGGYAVEGRGSFLVDSIEGCLFGVVGLPLFRIHAALRELGWRFGGG